LYPELYVRSQGNPRNWRPVRQVERPRERRAERKMINDKWAPIMRKQGVDTNLSM
jgi:hypothetical protein